MKCGTARERRARYQKEPPGSDAMADGAVRVRAGRAAASSLTRGDRLQHPRTRRLPAHTRLLTLMKERQPAVLDCHAPDYALRAFRDVQIALLERQVRDAVARAFGQYDAAVGEPVGADDAHLSALKDRGVQVAAVVERHAVRSDTAFHVRDHVRDV